MLDGMSDKDVKQFACLLELGLEQFNLALGYLTQALKDDKLSRQKIFPPIPKAVVCSINMKPDDVLIIIMPERMTMEDMDRIKEVFAAVGINKVVVCDNGEVDFAVVKKLQIGDEYDV